MSSVFAAPPSLVPRQLTKAHAAVSGWILYRWIRATIDSSTLITAGHQEVLDARGRGRPLIFVGWHGHDFVNIGIYHPLFGFDAKALLMIPETRGGAVLRQAAKHMNLTIVHLNAGGAADTSRSVVNVIKLVRDGYDALLAVDGPAGPALHVKPGVALIAQRAGAVIVPTAVSAGPGVRLRYRWDDHLIPVPAGHIGIHFGPLIDTAPGPETTTPALPDVVRRVEQALHDGTRKAAALIRDDRS